MEKGKVKFECNSDCKEQAFLPSYQKEIEKAELSFEISEEGYLKAGDVVNIRAKDHIFFSGRIEYFHISDFMRSSEIEIILSHLKEHKPENDFLTEFKFDKESFLEENPESPSPDMKAKIILTGEEQQLYLQYLTRRIIKIKHFILFELKCSAYSMLREFIGCYNIIND